MVCTIPAALAQNAVSTKDTTLTRHPMYILYDFWLLATHARWNSTDVSVSDDTTLPLSPYYAGMKIIIDKAVECALGMVVRDNAGYYVGITNGDCFCSTRTKSGVVYDGGMNPIGTLRSWRWDNVLNAAVFELTNQTAAKESYLKLRNQDLVGNISSDMCIFFCHHKTRSFFCSFSETLWFHATST